MTDEYGQEQPAGDLTLGAGGTFSVSLARLTPGVGPRRPALYTVVVSGRDLVGNSASCTALVSVPHDQRRP